jgi:cyclophilin family peptidyl-prolyl cis-trans isomerase
MMIRKIAVVALAAVSASLCFADEPAPAKQKQYDKPPEMKLDLNKSYTATITTNKGKIVLDLFAKDAPQSVISFVFLAREGFYDGVIFHRVIPDFMIQGGDPTGSGRGGPGYQIPNENMFSRHGFTPGTLAMANAGPNTNGSQFFITDAAVQHLTADKYTIFGEVKEGMDVVKQIARMPRNRSDRPLENVVMEKVEIEEK